MIKWFLYGLAGAVVLFFAPLVALHLLADIRTADTAKPAEATLIFGAIVRDGTISPLHQERLDTAIALWHAGKTQRLVVSNAPSAARSMQRYLVNNGVPAAIIEIDGGAERTPQTCGRERSITPPRPVIMVSQTFHLPRIYFQCWQLGMGGQLVTATPATRPPAPLITKIRVRSKRHIREAALTWGAILGLYPN